MKHSFEFDFEYKITDPKTIENDISTVRVFYVLVKGHWESDYCVTDGSTESDLDYNIELYWSADSKHELSRFFQFIDPDGYDDLYDEVDTRVENYLEDQAVSSMQPGPYDFR